MSNQCEMPAATTYLYKQQRNTETGEERIALRMGYVAGSRLKGFMRASAANWIEDGRPNIVQVFVPPKQLKNNVVRVDWTQSNMQLTRLTNNSTTSLSDSNQGGIINFIKYLFLVPVVKFRFHMLK